MQDFGVGLGRFDVMLVLGGSILRLAIDPNSRALLVREGSRVCGRRFQMHPLCADQQAPAGGCWDCGRQKNHGPEARFVPPWLLGLGQLLPQPSENV